MLPTFCKNCFCFQLASSWGQSLTRSSPLLPPCLLHPGSILLVLSSCRAPIFALFHSAYSPCLFIACDSLASMPSFSICFFVVLTFFTVTNFCFPFKRLSPPEICSSLVSFYPAFLHDFVFWSALPTVRPLLLALPSASLHTRFCFSFFFFLLSAEPARRALLHPSKLPRNHFSGNLVFSVLFAFPAWLCLCQPYFCFIMFFHFLHPIRILLLLLLLPYCLFQLVFIIISRLWVIWSMCLLLRTSFSRVLELLQEVSRTNCLPLCFFISDHHLFCVDFVFDIHLLVGFSCS